MIYLFTQYIELCLHVCLLLLTYDVYIYIHTIHCFGCLKSKVVQIGVRQHGCVILIHDRPLWLLGHNFWPFFRVSIGSVGPLDLSVFGVYLRALIMWYFSNFKEVGRSAMLKIVQQFVFVGGRVKDFNGFHKSSKPIWHTQHFLKFTAGIATILSPPSERSNLCCWLMLHGDWGIGHSCEPFFFFHNIPKKSSGRCGAMMVFSNTMGRYLADAWRESLGYRDHYVVSIWFKCVFLKISETWEAQLCNASQQSWWVFTCDTCVCAQKKGIQKSLFQLVLLTINREQQHGPQHGSSIANQVPSVIGMLMIHQWF